MALTREHLHHLSSFLDFPVQRPDPQTVDAVLRAATDRFSLVVTIEVSSLIPGKTEYRCEVRKLIGDGKRLGEATRGSALGATVFLALVTALRELKG